MTADGAAFVATVDISGVAADDSVVATTACFFCSAGAVGDAACLSTTAVVAGTAFVAGVRSRVASRELALSSRRPEFLLAVGVFGGAALRLPSGSTDTAGSAAGSGCAATGPSGCVGVGSVDCRAAYGCVPIDSDISSLARADSLAVPGRSTPRVDGERVADRVEVPRDVCALTFVSADAFVGADAGLDEDVFALDGSSVDDLAAAGPSAAAEADPEDGDDSDEEPVSAAGSAHATCGMDASEKPTPSATASPPTRPMFLAKCMPTALVDLVIELPSPSQFKQTKTATDFRTEQS